MTPSAIPSHRSLLRELFWTRTGLLMSTTALLGIGLLALSAVLSADSAGSNITFALGTGLLAAGVFSLAQTVIAATATNRMLVDAIADQTRTALRELTNEYRSLDTTYLPTHVFEGSPRPDPTFNRQLTRDLLASQTYLFRGLSARHTAARLLAAPLRHWEVWVIIADLSAQESLHRHARHQVAQGSDTDLRETYAKIRHRIRYGLVGLYAARLRCSRISITVTRSPSFDRFEIFDDSIWATLFSDATEPTTAYPRSLRFARDSVVYAMQRRDFQLATEGTPTEVIEPTLTESEFLATFERLTGEAMGSDALGTLHDDFELFRAAFVTEAGLDHG